MKQLSLVLLCLFFPAAMLVTAQTQNVDSLVNVLETGKLTDDDRSNIYRDVTSFYASRNPRMSLSYAKQGLALAEKRKNKEDACWFSLRLGSNYEKLGVIDTAMTYLNKALVLANDTKIDKKNKALVYGNMGNLYYRQNNMTASLEYFLKGKVIADEIGDKSIQLNALFSIAGIHRTLFNLDQAIDYYEQIEVIAKELKDTVSLCDFYYGMGNVYIDKKEYSKAIEYNHQLIDMSKAIDYMRGEMLGMLGLATIYRRNEFSDFENALKYIQMVMPIAEKYGDPRVIANTNSILAEIYYNLGRYEEAENAALEALKTDSLEMGITTRNALASLVVINILSGKKEPAIDYLVKYVYATDQYNDKSFHNSLTDMQTKYETEKKETRIASLEQERQLYVWLVVAGGLVVFFMGLGMLQTIRNGRKKRQLIAVKAVQDGEMGERARIAEDLHDRLGGSLAAVKIEIQNTERLQNVSDKLDQCIKEVREITHNLMPRSLRTAGMKTALEDFTAQFPNVHFHFFGEEKRINERLEFIVYCCANELVTNSIRYSSAKNINVQLVQSEKHASLIVQDDGCGFDEKNITQGMGLKNIRDRVASCNGKLDIVSSVDKGTETVIELKVNS